MVETLLEFGPHGKAALKDAAKWMEAEQHMQHLYTCQAALELHIEAGMTACGLFPHAQTFEQV